ncbi:hypothetical protein GCM10022206_76030 [Streptomyces chiangmaiensis]
MYTGLVRDALVAQDLIRGFSTSRRPSRRGERTRIVTPAQSAWGVPTGTGAPQVRAVRDHRNISAGTEEAGRYGGAPSYDDVQVLAQSRPGTGA